MTFSQQIELGFRTYFKAISFIFSNGLWWAFLFPVVMNILLFLGGYSFVDPITMDIQEWALNKMEFARSDSFLADLVGGVIWLMMKILFFFVFAYFGGYITLILLSPLFAYLSERTEEIVSGNKYPFSLNQFVKDVVRGILMALRNIFMETVWTILLFILGFIPVIGWLGVIPFFIISAYFYGFSFIDYTSERRKLSLGRSVDFVRRHKGLAIANGSLFGLCLLIPFVGVLLSGSLAIVSVVAATLAVNEIAPVQKQI